MTLFLDHSAREIIPIQWEIFYDILDTKVTHLNDIKQHYENLFENAKTEKRVISYGGIATKEVITECPNGLYFAERIGVVNDYVNTLNHGNIHIHPSTKFMCVSCFICNNFLSFKLEFNR